MGTLPSTQVSRHLNNRGHPAEGRTPGEISLDPNKMQHQSGPGASASEGPSHPSWNLPRRGGSKGVSSHRPWDQGLTDLGSSTHRETTSPEPSLGSVGHALQEIQRSFLKTGSASWFKHKDCIPYCFLQTTHHRGSWPLPTPRGHGSPEMPRDAAPSRSLPYPSHHAGAEPPPAEEAMLCPLAALQGFCVLGGPGQ